MRRERRRKWQRCGNSLYWYRTIERLGEVTVFMSPIRIASVEVAPWGWPPLGEVPKENGLVIVEKNVHKYKDAYPWDIKGFDKDIAYLLKKNLITQKSLKSWAMWMDLAMTLPQHELVKLFVKGSESQRQSVLDVMQILSGESWIEYSSIRIAVVMNGSPAHENLDYIKKEFNVKNGRVILTGDIWVGIWEALSRFGITEC